MDGPTSTTVLQNIGQYIADIRYEDLPAEVVGYTKRVLLDSLGCLYGGLDSAPATMVLETVREVGGNPRSTIVADGVKTSMEQAALANGVALRYLDFNDTYFGPAWTAHASDNICTLLAVAESGHRTGRDLLLAMVIAYEVQMSFSDLSVERNLWHDGWHHSAACAYSAAAGVGKLLALDGDGTAHAMALSGARANTFAQIRHGDIPMDKALSAPLVASRAIPSALLAQRGFTGQLTLLEGKYGFQHAVAGGTDVRSLVPQSGGPFKIMKNALKPYPVEGMTPAMVEAALVLREEVPLVPEDIRGITIYVHEEALSKPSWDSSKLVPSSKETADHSFTFCVAVALVAGQVTSEQFTDRWFWDPQVRRLMECTDLQTDDRLTSAFRKGGRPAAVRIDLGDRSVFREILYPLGSPENPMTDAQVADKFIALARTSRTEQQIRQIVEATRNIEQEPDIADFVAMLTPGAPGA